MTEVLEREIRAAHNSVRNALSTRENHPSYGVTKASLFEKLYRLEGLLIAHRIVTDPDCPLNPGGLIGPWGVEAFGFNIYDLHAEIRSAR